MGSLAVKAAARASTFGFVVIQCCLVVHSAPHLSRSVYCKSWCCPVLSCMTIAIWPCAGASSTNAQRTQSVACLLACSLKLALSSLLACSQACSLACLLARTHGQAVVEGGPK